MTFPQTTAIQAVQDGQEFWRLFTPLDSSGDIYESESSGRAFVMGSQSDVSQVGVTYFDFQAPDNSNCVTVSVDKPLIGRLDALGTKDYQTGDRARILISTNDLIPPVGFRPPLAGGGDGVQIVTPRLDLLQYLSAEPTFIAPRANRIHLFENLPSGGGATVDWFLVPFYGRRFAEITLKMLGIVPIVNGPALDVDVFGLNFSNVISDPSLTDVGHQEELLVTLSIAAPVALGAGVTDSITITNRAFDYIEVRLTYSSAHPSNSFNVHITTSDKI